MVLQLAVCGITIFQRHVLGILLFFGTLVAYMQRSCLSMAITQMVNAPTVNGTTNSTNHHESYCPANPTNSHANSSSNIETNELVSVAKIIDYMYVQMHVSSRNIHRWSGMIGHKKSKASFWAHFSLDIS